jgi:beta-glucosidase
VKVALGLFDSARPAEGEMELLGSGGHRALAREAVRRSLVLLKNRPHVLPIRAGAHVLVSGEAADDIGRQCGGWTMGWEGREHDNSAFPQGQSIYAGLRQALMAGGGSVELSPDGGYRNAPDVAIVVFGEHPYAEGLGDLEDIDSPLNGGRDLALLQRLRAAHIPLVAVFLSGRPRVVDQEINAVDAFVAAWLPGTEGAGVADVLIGDARGASRYPFTGRLPFSWPAAAGHARYARGFGLRDR